MAQEGIDAISDVIYHLETYDVTTIRAGTPMFLLARKIKVPTPTLALTATPTLALAPTPALALASCAPSVISRAPVDHVTTHVTTHVTNM